MSNLPSLIPLRSRRFPAVACMLVAILTAGCGRNAAVAKHLDKGLSAYNTRNFAGAASEYREALQLSPANFDAHRGLARALEAAGDLDGAVTEYRETVRLDPGHADPHVNLADALARTGDLDGAIAEYRKAMEVNPQYPGVRDLLMDVLAKKNDVDGLLAEYRAEIQEFPNEPQWHIEMARLLAGKGEFDDAIQEFRNALKLGPRNFSLHGEISDILVQKHDYAGAIAECRQWIKEDRFKSDPHVRMGVILRDHMNSPEAAMAEFHQALHIDPSDAGAHYQLATELEKEHDLKHALLEYQLAYKYSINNYEKYADDGIARVKKQLAAQKD